MVMISISVNMHDLERKFYIVVKLLLYSDKVSRLAMKWRCWKVKLWLYLV